MNDASTLSVWRRVRKRTAEVMYSANRDDPLTHKVDVGLIALISLNVIAVILESVHSIGVRWQTAFFVFEVFSVFVFSVEYIARVWSAVDDPWPNHYTHPVWGRLRYMLTWMALIDLLAILPFYLAFIFNVDLRFLRVLRLLRIFKLTRYSSAMTLLFQVIREEARTIGAAMFVLMLLVVLASSLAFLAEYRAQPDVFSSIPATMWWAIITMTTVGYGDMVPITMFGKILGGVIGIMGIGMVALPAGILASGFSGALRRRRKMLEEKVDDIMKDGHVSPLEMKELHHMILNLNLSEADARAVMEAAHHDLAHPHAPSTCPHCGKPISADSPAHKHDD